MAPATRTCWRGCSRCSARWPGAPRRISSDAIAEQLARLRATAAAQDFDQAAHAGLAGLADLVEEAQAGRWPIAHEDTWSDR